MGEPEEKECTISFVRGVEGMCVCIDDYRVAGPKPWGGGAVIKEFKAKRSDVLKAFSRRDAMDTRAQDDGNG